MDLCCAVEICELGYHALPPGSAGYHSTDEGQSGGRKPDTSAFVGTRAGLDGPKDEGAVIEKYAGFVDAVTRMGLGRAWEMTPLLRVSIMTLRQVCRVYGSEREPKQGRCVANDGCGCSRNKACRTGRWSARLDPLNVTRCPFKQTPKQSSYSTVLYHTLNR